MDAAGMKNWSLDTNTDLSTLLGKTAVSAEKAGDNDEIHIEFDDGTRLLLYHEQDCCECVRVEDIVGDLADLVGSPLTMSEEVAGECGEDEDAYESYTWTYYKFATVKGYVTIRFLGTSNGYYSESVSTVIMGAAQ